MVSYNALRWMERINEDPKTWKRVNKKISVIIKFMKPAETGTVVKPTLNYIVDGVPFLMYKIFKLKMWCLKRLHITHTCHLQKR